MTSPAKIIEFVEPCKRLTALSSSNNKTKKQSSTSLKRRLPTPDDDEEEETTMTKEAKRTIVTSTIGSFGLSEKEKWRREEERLVSLGCAPRKKQKIPLNIYLSMMKTRRDREKKKEETERQNDLVKGRVSSYTRSTNSGGNSKRLKNKGGGEFSTLGSFKDGVLRIRNSSNGTGGRT